MTSLPPLPPRAPAGATDTMLRLATIAALLLASFMITRPFIGLLAWTAILAVILYPLHQILRGRAGLGNAATATVIGLVLTALLLVPVLIVVQSIAESLIHVLQGFKAGTLVMPPAPPRLATLPVVGGKLAAIWAQMEANLPAAIERYRPFLTDVVSWLGGFVGGMATAVLTFVAALVLASILIAHAERTANFARDGLSRLTGSRETGQRFATLAVATIRGVSSGVIGVAFIQALLLGIGFFVIGVPGAGLLALASLLLGIVQMPAMIVALPVILYVFATMSTTPAIVFTVWTIIAGLSDAVLKPLMLGRGLEVPMPVILIGVIGGMITGGLVGLFIGPVVLAIAYALLVDWVRPVTPQP